MARISAGKLNRIPVVIVSILTRIYQLCHQPADNQCVFELVAAGSDHQVETFLYIKLQD